MMIELTEIAQSIVHSDMVFLRAITINTERIQTIRQMWRNDNHNNEYTEITMCDGEKINVKQQYKEITEKTYPIIPRI